ncbi:hypothetical protein VY88_26280 [Azospirillum thiophilum]|uniref:Tail protein n=1 Tax=Azospirillum thiophilum TaxID=528244 RepID=A0AAC8W4V1_9PROT|nr:hypothetical protein [Azospirillum thiophilum]ALG75047.1 hypothetical protein AL072_29190 [Azospirillum thiophilum]KJR62439.1 hypothetical protein VY88_26280 [Azospirillum thiophilum]
MTALIAWIAEIGLTRPNGTTETLYVSDTPILPFPPDDPDRPNQPYRSRLAGPPPYSVGTHADLSRLAGDVGAGSIDLLNGDGAVSYLAGCAMGAVHVRMGSEGQYWHQWTPVITGRAEAPQPTLSARSAGKVSLPLYDLRASLDSDVVTRTLGGTNAGAVGYDGTPDAGKGDTVPLCIGRPANVPGKAVNTVSRTWLLDDGPIGTPGALYDRGDAANLGYLGNMSPAFFDAATLSSTQYASDNSRGLVKLGGTIGGDLSMDPTGRTDAGETAASAIRWALTRRGIGTIGDTLAGWAPAATIGAWWPGAVRYRELVDMMARSEGAAVLPDALGRWQVARLDVPAGPIASIGEGQILDIGVDDQDLAVPAWQVTVKGRRNHLVLDRSRTAGILWDTDREVWLREEWRKAVAKADWVKARWGDDARSVEVETALTSQADMEALASRLLALFGPRASGEPRRSLWVVVEMTAARLGWPLGTTLHLGYPREGIADDMLLVGKQLASPSRHLMRLRFFG